MYASGAVSGIRCVILSNIGMWTPVRIATQFEYCWRSQAKDGALWCALDIWMESSLKCELVLCSPNLNSSSLVQCELLSQWLWTNWHMYAELQEFCGYCQTKRWQLQWDRLCSRIKLRCSENKQKYVGNACWCSLLIVANQVWQNQLQAEQSAHSIQTANMPVGPWTKEYCCTLFQRIQNQFNKSLSLMQWHVPGPGLWMVLSKPSTFQHVPEICIISKSAAMRFTLLLGSLKELSAFSLSCLHQSSLWFTLCFDLFRGQCRVCEPL